MKKNWLKNTALATVLATTLTACGGGGGGGASSVIIDPINDFVDNNLGDISGGTQLADTFAGLVTNFQSTQTGGISVTDIISNYASGQALIPDDTDKEYAGQILTTINETLDWWNVVETAITNTKSITDKQRVDFYNTTEYKKAVKAIKFLEKSIKPVVTKITNGQTITETQFNFLTDTTKADAEMAKYESEADDYVNTKITDKVKTALVEVELTPVLKNTETVPGTPVITGNTDSDWKYVNGQGGLQRRTVTTTTPQTIVKTFEYCTEKRKVYKDDNYHVIGQSCTTGTTETGTDNLVSTEVQEQMGENYVVSTKDVSPDADTQWIMGDDEEHSRVIDSSVTDDDAEEQEGMATTESIERIETTKSTSGDQTTTTKTKYIDTKVTTPVTITLWKTVHYTITTRHKKKLETIEHVWTEETYADGTTNITKNTKDAVYGSWVYSFTTEPLSVREKVSETLEERIVITKATNGTVVSQVTTSNAYTDDDSNLGTQTVGYNSDKTTYETAEYKDHYDSKGKIIDSYKKIKVSSAYSKGWTGTGSVVAVADTGYDVDHEDLSGQIIDTKDYTETGIDDNHGHGTHVLGSIVAKKNGNGMHGVAFDAKAIVIKVGDSSYINLDNAAIGFGWAADQGAIVGNLSANSNYDNGFKNGIVKINDGIYKSTSAYYDYGNGIYYNNMTTDPWKVSTDKGLVLVNSAGNQGLKVSAMPGWLATETDSNGDLVLGGKVLIVGAYNTSLNSIEGWSNQAGHLCRVIVDNTCRDQYKTSDFYVLAPSKTYSTKNDGTYASMEGTSMSAPIVTGQIAILHQMWPHMKGENLVRLVTATADKTIPYYDVNIHGQGLVDFDEATKPQGAVGIPTTGRVDGSISSISNTHMSSSSTSFASLSNLKIMVLDDYDRDYYLNLGNSFTVKDNRKYSDVQMLVDNKNTFLPHQQMYGSFAQGGQYDLNNNFNFGFYTGENGGGDYSANVGKDFYLNKKFKVRTSLGYMSEQETWLGNTSDGVLAVGDNNDTTSANIGVAYQLGNNVLTLDYSKGKTDINTVDYSLIKSFSDVETESYRLAYEIHKDTHTTFGWSFSLPSHVTSGTMDLEVAESVNLDGTINYTNINSDLTQDTKEKNIGFFYSKSPAQMFDTGFNFTAEYRMDKSGVANNDGVEMAVQMVKKFAGNCKFLWMKNPKCFDKDGNMKADLFGKNTDNVTKHGLVYDLETDKFVPIKKGNK